MKFISFLGLFVMMLIAWLLSSNRRKMDWRLIVSGLLLQFALAGIILGTRPGKILFAGANTAITAMLKASDAGAAFVFGEGFQEHYFAFSVLPTIIFISSLMAIFFHLGIIQFIVKILARIMVWVMDTSGSESLCAAANVFVGQTEAPLVVRGYLPTMTRSELMAMMTGGMATIAGGVMAAYVGMGIDAGHLLSASFMSAPASLVIAKILYPELENSPTKGEVRIEVPRQDTNILDAACRGAGEGLKLALNVAAMLIAFLALLYLINLILGLLPQVGGADISLERILGLLLAPLAWIMGIEWADAHAVGVLIGKKIIANEFIAYMDLTAMKEQLSPRSFTIATYALCGFANFGSIGILIGGLGNLVPERRKDFAKLSFKAMIGGALAAFMTACIVGMFI
ncbi:MAG: NupC/NupG family nucleoside CNT transporter [Candidatus Sumerlaeia bacterium]